MLYPNVLMVPKLPILCDIDAVGADCHFRNRDLEYGEYVKEISGLPTSLDEDSKALQERRLCEEGHGGSGEGLGRLAAMELLST